MRVGKAGEGYFVEDISQGEANAAILTGNLTSALGSVDENEDGAGLTLNLSRDGDDPHELHTYDATIADWQWG
jgi:hypothetical protein